MRINTVFLVTMESGLILLYIYMISFSIFIFPINLILGIICVLWIPGNNLLKLIKPKSTLVEKIGLTVIFSIALDNIIMFFYYIFLYNVVITPENPWFFFNEKLLIYIILFLSLILILLNQFKNLRNVETKKNIKEYMTLEINLDPKVVLVYIVFGLSIALLIISTLSSRISNNAFSEVQIEYNYTFTFFNNVPLIFYLFLAISISCLIYIIFFTKNRFLILISISIFIYCIWIIPYLQIGNYFSNDPNILSKIYNNYLIYGIRTRSTNPFIVKTSTFTNYMYSTSLFTSIILVSATGVDINTVLWYIYPLIFFFIPFLFYSYFQKYSKEDKEDSLICNIILTILAMLSPIILRNAHSATTGVIGAILYIILVVEFFDMVNNKGSNFKIRNFFSIIFLFFFLCLTHVEECFYFLFLIFLYLIYFAFFESRKIKFKNTFDSSSVGSISNSIKNKNRFKINNEIKRVLLFVGSLLIVLSLIFYITLEFFGYLNFYFITLVSTDSILVNIFNNYLSTRVPLPLLAGTYHINFYIIGIIIFGLILFLMFCYFTLFKYNDMIYSWIVKIIKKIHLALKKVISLKYFLLSFYILFFTAVLIIEMYFIHFLQEEGLFLIIEIFLNYSILFFQSFLFVIGIFYYKNK